MLACTSVVTGQGIVFDGEAVSSSAEQKAGIAKGWNSKRLEGHREIAAVGRAGVQTSFLKPNFQLAKVEFQVPTSGSWKLVAYIIDRVYAYLRVP